MIMHESFVKFLGRLLLTQSQREDARTKYDGVCKKLHDHYYPGIGYTGQTKLLIGSYGKHTNIRPPRDVDVLFFMPDEKFAAYDDNSANGQSQLLQDVRKVLSEKYSTTEKIRAWGKVVLVEFSDGTHNVEVVPAWERDDGTFLIPDTANGGSWRHWNPRAELRSIGESDKKTNGTTRTLIRFIKKWAEQCSVDLSSFEIEQGVLQFLESQFDPDESYPILVREFFLSFKDVVDDKARSHVTTASRRSAKACNYEEEGETDAAVNEWRKVFGKEFPSPEQESSRTIEAREAKPQLADISHRRPMPWPYEEMGKVRIDAYTYYQRNGKRLGGINSDGRTLPKEIALKYVAGTDLAGDLEYHWQVVNTGTEAAQKHDLRGGFDRDKRIHWETTRYSGKHWIECFVVEDDRCVARSGRFYVNIR